MSDVDASKRPAALALGAIGVCGAVGVGLVLGLTRVGAPTPAIGALALPTVLVALLWLTVWMTAAGSPLAGATGRKVAWVLLGAGFAAALGGLGLASTGGPGLVLAGGGAVVVVVAGVLLRGWRARLTALGAVVALAATGLTVFAQSGPSELAERLAHADPPVQRDLLYVVSIPGYRPLDTRYGDDVGIRQFMPVDPAAVPAQRWINILEYAREYAYKDPGPCGETARDSVLQIAECTVEPDGWIYRHGVVHHGYEVIVGQSIVVVAGPLDVDQKVLRAAAAKVRPATAAELDALGFPGEQLFTAESPGYLPRAIGIPHGVQLQPSDPAAAPQSMMIDVYVDFSELPCGGFGTCTPDTDGLQYRRYEDTYGYVVRRGNLNLYAMGGVGVDKALLRQAVLTARPVTDAELLRSLPPVPHKGLLDRLRAWLRT
ncbi:hypothetical protein ACFO1B_09080 [Dactylosporangium siamense]|uniref:Uncharacterized protein n=1 Tax=Dactylosporangium siamense TaxID=685454 RepID=A0A919PQ41_9ACTN|nr:hypothetical protein [Dactylosporangium siamense]GIG48840.1 hypothetical protein Dsi01nite_068810 [Dactylosporangium siamense]